MSPGGIVLPFRGVLPRVAADAYVAPGACLIGDVEIGAGASVWFQCVLRGDVSFIRVGEGANIQDGTVVHVSRHAPGETVIGADVTIGHKAIIHACHLEPGCFIGMGAIVMDRCVVERGAMVAAGALLPPGKRVPAGQVWAGSPARYWRELRPEERTRHEATAAGYRELAQAYRSAQGLGGGGEVRV